jgi:hypothetical protein
MAIAIASALSVDGRPRLRMSFQFDLDPASEVDTPLDRTELGSELVIIGIDVDLTLLKAFSQCPVVLRSSVAMQGQIDIEPQILEVWRRVWSQDNAPQ